MSKFNNPLDPENVEIRKAIRSWVIEKLSLDTEKYAIEINENTCTEPYCIHSETLIIIAAEATYLNEKTSENLYYSISKPIIFVRKIDIQNMQLRKNAEHHKHL
jgi:hypothetical protein